MTWTEAVLVSLTQTLGGATLGMLAWWLVRLAVRAELNRKPRG